MAGLGASARKGGADEMVSVDAKELRELIQRIRDVSDRKLKSALRKTLRESADLAVKGVQAEVLKPPPARFKDSGRSRSTGLRADIAKATKASLQGGGEKSGAQVTIVAANSRLQPRHKGMAKAYNSGEFRHPVYGTKDKWVPQRGQRNYFGLGVAGRREEMLRRLQAAMDDVAQQITG